MLAHVLSKEQCSFIKNSFDIFHEIIVNHMDDNVEAEEYFAVFQTSNKKLGMWCVQALRVDTIRV